MKKNRIKLLFLSVLAVLTLGFATRETVHAEAMVTSMVTTAAVNFRSTPIMGNNIICVIPEGATVTVFKKTDAGWYNINYNNAEGYVYSTYLNYEDKSSSGTSTKMFASCSLNVRDYPANSGQIVTVLQQGQSVEILGKENVWYKVRANGVTGYCYEKYLEYGQDNKIADEDRSRYTLTATTSLNVRSAPSNSASVIGWYKEGDPVDIISEAGGWYEVYFKNQTAYAYSGYIK